MRYNTYGKEMYLAPCEFDKDSGKEILQYSVGSLLYMPANNSRIADKIINKVPGYENIKSFVLDLEDALGDDMVKFGQRQIREVLDKFKQAIQDGTMEETELPLIFIRIREYKQINDIVDMLGEDIQYVTGFNAPKFDKTTCDGVIDSFRFVRDQTRRKYGKELYIMPIIESKHAMYRQLRMENLLYINNALRPIADSVLNIRVGGVDFCNIFGVRRPIDATIYEVGPVGDCLNDILNVFGKSYVVSAPVWEYFGKEDETEEWVKGLKKELRADKLNGFIGKTCIHPVQLRYIQENLMVSQMDYEDAISILGMNPNTTGVKKSEHKNRMNEVKTHTNWAKKVVGQARVYGVRKDTNNG